MTWIRKLRGYLRLTGQVAKPTDQLIERADEAIKNVDTLRLQVVTRQDRVKARMHALDIQAQALKHPR